MKNKIVLCTITMIVIMLLLVGCNMFPQPKSIPWPQKNQPNAQVEPEITVYMHETDQVQAMKMEEYIQGVVAGEMQSNWPIKALAAQAILARTFTLEAMERGGVPSRGTNASTDIKEFQAYNKEAINDNVKQAVEMTRGVIITYEGKPAKTWFHASAGGKTATAKEGLNYKDAEPAYIKSVDSPDDLAPEDVKKWTANFSVNDVITALQKQNIKIDSLESISLGEKGPSGRTTVFMINGKEQANAPELRIALDSKVLKSTLLEKVEKNGTEVSFTGTGYGHGVGMSQWGANKMAQEGKGPEEIVQHYYPGTKIEKRYQ